MKNQIFTTIECQDISDLMNKKYAHILGDKNFEVKSFFEGPGIKINVILQNHDQSFYYPVEGRIIPDKEELNIKEALYFLLDYIDGYFEEYLTEDEMLRLPIDWTDYSYCGVDFQLKGQQINLKIEQMANELLKKK